MKKLKNREKNYLLIQKIDTMIITNLIQIKIMKNTMIYWKIKMTLKFKSL